MKTSIHVRRGLASIPVHLIFLLLAFPVVLLLSTLTPPFQVADEVEHYLYARAITQGSILPHELPSGGVGGTVQQADMELIEAFDTGVSFHAGTKVKAASYLAAQHAANLAPVEQNYWGAAIYPPVTYVAQATAMRVADGLGFNRLRAFHTGRMAGGLFFVLAATLAIALAPCGKTGLAFVLMLPMTLYQAASFSADSFVFALVPLVCALMARESMREAPPRTGILALAGGLVALIALIKAPMVALLIPLAVLAGRRSWALAGLITCLVIGCVVGWILGFTLTEAQAGRTAGLGRISTSAQFDHLMASPLSVFSIASKTIETLWIFYFKGIIGIFGWLDTYLAPWYYWVAFVVFVILLGATLFDSVGLPARQGWAFSAAAVLAIALTFGAMYLTWTEVGAPAVNGVQGRYLIPVLFPLVFALAGGMRRFHVPALAGVGVPVLWIFWAISLMHMVRAIVVRFYIS